MLNMFKCIIKKALFLLFLVSFLSSCSGLNSEHDKGSYSKNYSSKGDLNKSQKKNLYKRLVLANNFHSSKKYSQAYEIYESILANQDNLLANIYAIWGVVALKIDRDNPEYDRQSASRYLDIMEERIQNTKQQKTIYEAKLLKFSAELMVQADYSKDTVIDENKVLIAEIAQRDEAIKRLRELSLGQ